MRHTYTSANGGTETLSNLSKVSQQLTRQGEIKVRQKRAERTKRLEVAEGRESTLQPHNGRGYTYNSFIQKNI